jgi:cell division FtsZ-interacting protein ZapD
LNKGFPIESMNVDQASYTDNVISNQKYYYAFRTMTYHGTPSQLTNPIEIEIQRDSDEYKISINKYEYPIRKDYSTQKSAKRLIRIVPNLERLFFSKEEDANNWELDNGSLVVNAISSNHKTFKIRATSKHTGKKIDLNITFKLNKDDTFNT